MRFSTIAMAAAAGVASAQDSPSICDKYTTALLKDNTPANQFTLVALLVKTAVLGNFTGPGSANPTLPGSMVNFKGLLAPGTYNGEQVNLLGYFDGSLASTNRGGSSGVSVNFLDGQSNATDLVTMPMSIGKTGSNQATLFAHLVSYFGALLGCSGYGKDGYAAYAGSNNQYNVHKYMALSEAEHSYFIQNVGMSAKSFGASDADITTVAMSLNSTFGYRCAPAASVIPDTPANPQVICQGEGCPLATNAMAGCSGAAAVASFTPSEPASATATGSMTGSMTGSAAMTTGTGAAGAASSAAGSAGSAASGAAMSATGGSGNAAPRQTAAAGLLAGAAAVAAAML